jgi:hypothetical protein
MKTIQYPVQNTLPDLLQMFPFFNLEVNTEQHSPNEAITATSLPSNSLSSLCVACRGIAYINEQALLSQFHDNKKLIGHETRQRISVQLFTECL